MIKRMLMFIAGLLTVLGSIYGSFYILSFIESSSLEWYDSANIIIVFLIGLFLFICGMFAMGLAVFDDL